MPNADVSANEQQARYLLTDAIQRGFGLELVHARINRPPLTDEECVAIAVNYPFSWIDIRNAFPRA